MATKYKSPFTRAVICALMTIQSCFPTQASAREIKVASGDISIERRERDPATGRQRTVVEFGWSGDGPSNARSVRQTPVERERQREQVRSSEGSGWYGSPLNLPDHGWNSGGYRGGYGRPALPDGRIANGNPRSASPQVPSQLSPNSLLTGGDDGGNQVGAGQLYAGISDTELRKAWVNVGWEFGKESDISRTFYRDFVRDFQTKERALYQDMTEGKRNELIKLVRQVANSDAMIAIDRTVDTIEKNIQNRKFDVTITSAPQDYENPVDEANELLRNLNPEAAYPLERNNLIKPSATEKAHHDFKSPEGPFRASLEVLWNKLDAANPLYDSGRTAKDLGTEAVKLADQSNANGEIGESEMYKKAADGFLDIAVGLDPFTGPTRDIYEAVTGMNLVTGEPLSRLEYGFAVFGVVTFGLGSKIAKGTKILSHLSNRMSPIVQKSLRAAIETAQEVSRLAERASVKSAEQGRKLLSFTKRTFGNEVGAIGNASRLIDNAIIAGLDVSEEIRSDIAVMVESLEKTGRLPPHYITSEEALAKGWKRKQGNLAEVAPGKQIGGEVYKNKNKQLPEGIDYFKADVGYRGGYRGQERIIYSSDGKKIYYTNDHYAANSFVEIK